MTILAKANEMKRILLDSAISKQDKIINSCQQLSGIELTKFSRNVKKRIEKELIFLNSITKQYPIKTFEDYNLIAPAHLNQMINALTKLYQILELNGTE